MKDELRIKYRKIRKEIKDKDIKDKLICDNFLNCDIYKKAKVILAYYPLSEEINIIPIINDALLNKKQVALPITANKTGDMEFYFIDSIDNLVKGNFGIMEPIKDNKKRVIDFNDSICIVPGIIFDMRGYRIGYGKGYYDKFLRNNSITSVGLCYQEILQDNIPCDSYDVQVNYICVDE